MPSLAIIQIYNGIKNKDIDFLLVFMVDPNTKHAIFGFYN